MQSDVELESVNFGGELAMQPDLEFGSELETDTSEGQIFQPMVSCLSDFLKTQARRDRVKSRRRYVPGWMIVVFSSQHKYCIM